MICNLPNIFRSRTWEMVIKLVFTLQIPTQWLGVPPSASDYTGDTLVVSLLCPAQGFSAELPMFYPSGFPPASLMSD